MRCISSKRVLQASWTDRTGPHACLQSGMLVSASVKYRIWDLLDPGEGLWSNSGGARRWCNATGVRNRESAGGSPNHPFSGPLGVWLNPDYGRDTVNDTAIFSPSIYPYGLVLAGSYDATGFKALELRGPLTPTIAKTA
jgi:hypothetical protein